MIFDLSNLLLYSKIGFQCLEIDLNFSSHMLGASKFIKLILLKLFENNIVNGTKIIGWFCRLLRN